MIDLSNLAENSLWPTSQQAGNRPSDPAVAHTAPGSTSSAADEEDVARQPFAVVQDYPPPVLIGTGGAKVTPDANTARPSLFTADGGAEWKRTAGRSYPNMDGPEGTAAALRNSNPAREQR